MDEIMNSAVVGSLEILTVDSGKAFKLLWWLAANHPKTFIEAAAAQNCQPAIMASVDTLKARVKAFALEQCGNPGYYNGHSKIELIKAHRMLTKSSLKDAKDWVEQNFEFPY